MNRKGALIAVDTLIRLAIMLVVFIVVFVGIYPTISQKLYAAESESKCSWSILLASVQKLGSAGIAEGIPEGCKAKTLTVSMKELEKGQKLAKNKIQEYIDKKDVYNAQFFTSTSPNMLNEFALDKIIADELVSCWEKVFKGNMPLFDQWWRFYKPFWGKDQPGSGPEALDLWLLGEIKRAPVNCVICSRITFSDDVITNFGNREVDSLMEFMSLNPVPKTKTPYLQYVYEGQPGSDLLKPYYKFSVTNEGLAIIYERVNVQSAKSILETPVKWIGLISEKSQDLNYLKLVPYSQESIIAPDTGEGCTLIID